MLKLNFNLILNLNLNLKRNRTIIVIAIGSWVWVVVGNLGLGLDHPRDHPGKYLYYAGTFWLYLHSHCRLRNMTLVRVLYAYNGDLTMALV
jgi:hypothetical protein